MRIAMRLLLAALLVVMIALPAFSQDLLRSAQREGLTQPADEYEVGAFNDLGILTLKSKDGRFIWFTDIRLFLTAGGGWGSDKGNALANGAQIDQFRLSLNYVWDKTWLSQVDLEFDAGSPTSWQFQDMYLGYSGLHNTLIRAGQNKIPWGLENLTTERNINFFTRSAYIDIFKGGRRTGLTYNHWSNKYEVGAGVYGAGANDPVEPSNHDSGYRVAGRASYTPVIDDKNVVHLGISTHYDSPKAGSGDTISDKTGVETGLFAGNFFSTGKISKVDHVNTPSLEFAVESGGWRFQSEYAEQRVSRYGGMPNAKFTGYYGVVSWFPSGYHKPYNTEVGEFGKVIPKNKKGELELLVRYSVIDLNDPGANIYGGKGVITKAGANYYLGYNLKFRGELAHVKTDAHSIGDSKKPNDSFNYVQTSIELCF